LKNYLKNYEKIENRGSGFVIAAVAIVILFCGAVLPDPLSLNPNNFAS
jgi:hypothetical protein